MDIIRHESDHSLPSFQERVNQFLESLWSTHWEDNEGFLLGRGLRLKVYDSNDSAVIRAELPGMNREDVRVDITGRVLTLTGRRERANATQDKGYHRTERFMASFQRSIMLPAAVDPRSVEANFNEGVLKIIIPRPRVSQARKIPVE